jgi:hypothetical protein
MSSNPIPPKETLAQELGRIANTLTNDAQNAALKKCQELSFDTNKGMISLEETLINLSEARDILLDAVSKRKIIQLPLRLQYALYDQTQRIAQQLTSLTSGTDEIINLVNSVEDITAAIWQYNLRNLSGEVLGLQSKMNQLKAEETRIRQVSREAAEFSSLQDSARSALGQISQMASEASGLRTSMTNSSEEISSILSKAAEQGQRISSVAAQVDQHGTTATQQLATTKQAAADTEAAAKKSKELQGEIEVGRDSLQSLLGKAQESLASAQTAAEAQLADTKMKADGLVSASQESISALTTRLESAMAEQMTALKAAVGAGTNSLDLAKTEMENRVTKLVADASTQLTQLETAHETKFSGQLQEFILNAQNQQVAQENRLTAQLKEASGELQKQLTDQAATFNTQVTEWANRADQSVTAAQEEHKRLAADLNELEGRIRESIERATGYTLFHSFQKRQLDLAKAKRNWAMVLGGLVVVSLIASAVFIYHLQYVTVYNAAFYMKLSISIPLIYAIAFCNLQYSRERRLEEEYAFKSNISISLEPYQKLVEGLVDKTKPEELSKYTAFIIDSVTRVFTSPTAQIFETPGDKNSAEKLIKALGEFIEPVIKGLKR